ncbi:hypothetical protein F4861DRAFT_301591 [Xylaria intraflava]|nr:hypothetical protein F4861DRAFT_301591 [Xylaria intraflava]
MGDPGIFYLDAWFEDTRFSIASIVAVPVTTAISTAAVLLRFWCKISLKSGIHADDWWILATLLSFYGAQSATLWGLIKGIGVLPKGAFVVGPVPSIMEDKRPANYLESLFIFFTITLFTLYAAKISVCLLYRRIFATRSYLTLSTIAMGVATAWFVSVFIVNLIICIPVDLFWNRKKGEECLNFDLFYLLIGIFETIIDTLILVLPIRAVSNLKMSLKTKIVVSGIFLVGGITVITNISADLWVPAICAICQAVLWTEIHIAVVILCACLPVYRPVLTGLGCCYSWLRERLQFSIQTLRPSQTKTRATNTSSVDYDRSNYPMVRLHSSDRGHYVQDHFLSHESHVALVPGPVVATHISSIRADGPSRPIDVPRDGILRTRDIDVV